MSKKTLLALGASGVLALGIAAPAMAAAADNDKPASAAQSERRWGGFGGQHSEKLTAALAKELGLEESKVSDALKKVQEQLRADAKANGETKGDGTKPDAAARSQALKDRLAEAVKAGKLTQAEADAIIKATEAGVLGGNGPRGGWGGGGWGGEKKETTTPEK